MSDVFDLTCPACDRVVHVDQSSDGVAVQCPHCGNSIPLLDVGGPRSGATQPGEHVQQGRATGEFDLPSYGDRAADSRWTDVTLKPRGGETLAVLALLIPLIGLCIPAYSLETALLLGFGMVVLTTILLAVDAASMGTIDLDGNRRMTVTGLSVGMILLWIVFYPLAFFRRRHFGRPNLGPLGVLVVAVSCLVPFLKDDPFGGYGHKPPACTSPEVIELVDNLIRTGPMGPFVKSIGGYEEIRYDQASNTRSGWCVVETREGINKPVFYTVSWAGKDRRAFQVQIQDEGPPHLP